MCVVYIYIYIYIHAHKEDAPWSKSPFRSERLRRKIRGRRQDPGRAGRPGDEAGVFDM